MKGLNPQINFVEYTLMLQAKLWKWLVNGRKITPGDEKERNLNLN